MESTEPGIGRSRAPAVELSRYLIPLGSVGERLVDDQPDSRPTATQVVHPGGKLLRPLSFILFGQDPVVDGDAGPNLIESVSTRRDRGLVGHREGGQVLADRAGVVGVRPLE